jgi:hypothetical protein
VCAWRVPAATHSCYASLWLLVVYTLPEVPCPERHPAQLFARLGYPGAALGG